MSQRTELLTAALEHAARGLHVFPLWPDSKTPAVPDAWERRATRDPDLIRRWWAERPFNIGLAVGPSRLIVIDLDAPKLAHRRGAVTSDTSDTSQPTADPSRVGPGAVTDTSATAAAPDRHGRDVFAALCTGHGQPVPADTYTIATPHNGWQLYYQHPNGPALRNTKGGTGRALGEQIDTRGHGGYVVAASSILGGRRYTVVRDRPPAPLPGWLAALLRELDEAALRPAPARPVRVPLAPPTGAPRSSAPPWPAKPTMCEARRTVGATPCCGAPPPRWGSWWPVASWTPTP
jgi:hypothetical protein